MSVRLIISITAAPGKGDELAASQCERIKTFLQDEGCEQFEIFRSVSDPDRLVVLERWRDQASLDAHLELNKTRPKAPAHLMAGVSQREDYTYNRTR